MFLSTCDRLCSIFVISWQEGTEKHLAESICLAKFVFENRRAFLALIIQSHRYALSSRSVDLKNSKGKL